MPKIYFITGQTAVGKTDFAVALAERKQIKILNCDSLCFYRGMDIGTAKPSKEEQQRVPHLGIDLVPASKVFTIVDYLNYVEPILKEAFLAHQSLLVVGGSGFYLKSFFSPVADEIEVSDGVKERVKAIYQDFGIQGWVKELMQLNQGDELSIDLKNPRRVEKALIRCLSTGQSLSNLKEQFDQLPKPYAEWEKTLILLDRNADEMKERNSKRIELMLDKGLIEEVRKLKEEGFESNPSAASAIGYRETLSYLRGEIDLKEMKEEIYVHTNQLMRKQRAWFKHQLQPDYILNAVNAIDSLDQF